ncbi:hypothetical protein V5H32_23480, partial [Salmonella enterica]
AALILVIKGQNLYRHEVFDTRNAHRSTEYRPPISGCKMAALILVIKGQNLYRHEVFDTRNAHRSTEYRPP